MEHGTLIPDEDIVGFSKRILEREYEEIAKMSVSVIVATAFDVILEFRNRGMTFDQIAMAYTKNGVPMKGATLRWAFGKASKACQATHAPAARVSGMRSKAPPPLPASIQTKALATSETQAAMSRIAEPTSQADPASEPQESKPEPPKHLHEMTEKEKIDLIVSTIPAPDREYPELAGLRFWQDENGCRWDVANRPKDEPDDVMYRRACLMYANGRRSLFEKWGLGEVVTDGTLKLRYTLAKKPPLTVDLDQLIVEHLIT